MNTAELIAKQTAERKALSDNPLVAKVMRLDRIHREELEAHAHQLETDKNWLRAQRDTAEASRPEVGELQAFIEKLSDYSHGDLCSVCSGAGCIGIPGAACNYCEGSGKNRLALAFKWIAMEKDAKRYIWLRNRRPEEFSEKGLDLAIEREAKAVDAARSPLAKR